jgi:hypothetical protein
MKYPKNVVQIIGDLLTNIDTTLSEEDFKSSDPPNWQLLYAMRQQLNDQQCKLVTSSIDVEDKRYTMFAKEVAEAKNQIAVVISDRAKVGDVIRQTAEITARVDNVFGKLAYREPRPKGPILGTANLRTANRGSKGPIKG